MYEAFRDPELRAIINSLASGKTLSQRADVDNMQVEYSLDGKVIEGKSIERLKEMGVIKEAAGESYIACPFDGSTELRVALYCPVHDKPVSKYELYEDAVTGQLLGHGEARERKGFKRLYWFRCAEGEIVNSPRMYFICQNGHRFELNEAITVQIRSFEMEERAKGALADYELFISIISKSLGEQGYSVTAPASVKGMSGADYELDALVSSESTRVGILIMEIHDVSIQNVVARLPQIYDLSLSLTGLVLVMVPQLPPEIAKAFEKGNTAVITGDSLGGLVNEVLSRAALVAKQPQA